MSQASKKIIYGSLLLLISFISSNTKAHILMIKLQIKWEQLVLDKVIINNTKPLIVDGTMLPVNQYKSQLKNQN